MSGSPFKLFSILSIGLTACVSDQPSHVFDNAHVSEAEWARIRKECDYEAEKATASAPVNIAYYRWERLYVGCIELKGIKFLGMSNEIRLTH
jgi:hypothetical protein